MELDYEVIIIGGGPAGLSCGQYSARAGRKTAIVEEMACGGQTMIIDEIENYPGLEKISGYELGAKFEAQATEFGCNFVYDSVLSIEKKQEGLFEVTTSSKVLKCACVVIATGAKHRMLGVPGEKELTGHGVSYCATCDGPFFKGKNILVCGGGDSACQEAIYLRKLSEHVTICHRRDQFRAQAAVVDKMKAAGINTIMNAEILSINAESNKVSSVTIKDKATGEITEHSFDAVFVFVGNTPQSQLVPFVEKDEQGFIVTDAEMMTSVKGIFAAGDVRNTPFRQIVTAASDGAVAAHYANEYIDWSNLKNYSL